jgi:hypothetical protein
MLRAAAISYDDKSHHYRKVFPKAVQVLTAELTNHRSCVSLDILFLKQKTFDIVTSRILCMSGFKDTAASSYEE